MRGGVLTNNSDISKQQRHKTRQKQRGLSRVEVALPEALKRRVDELRGAQTRSQYIARAAGNHNALVSALQDAAWALEIENPKHSALEQVWWVLHQARGSDHMSQTLRHHLSTSGDKE